jgi:hypothetical protein
MYITSNKEIKFGWDKDFRIRISLKEVAGMPSSGEKFFIFFIATILFVGRCLFYKFT